MPDSDAALEDTPDSAPVKYVEDGRVKTRGWCGKTSSLYSFLIIEVILRDQVSLKMLLQDVVDETHYSYVA